MRPCSQGLQEASERYALRREWNCPRDEFESERIRGGASADYERCRLQPSRDPVHKLTSVTSTDRWSNQPFDSQRLKLSVRHRQQDLSSHLAAVSLHIACTHTARHRPVREIITAHPSTGKSAQEA